MQTDFNKLPPGSCVTWEFVHDQPIKPLTSDEVCAAIAFVMQRTQEIAKENPTWSTKRIRGELLRTEERVRFFSQSHPHIFATASENPPNEHRMQMIATQCQIMKLVEERKMPKWMAENIARETMVSSHTRPMTEEEKQRYETTGSILKQNDSPLTEDEKRRAPNMIESVVGAIGEPFEADFGSGPRPVNPNKIVHEF